MKTVRRYVFLVIVVGVAAGVGYPVWKSSQAVMAVLWENRELKEALANLTHEEQIGYAKVIDQSTDDQGRLWTTLKFVETDPGDRTRRVLEQEYTIQGDVIHFDALIVKFDKKLVMDGSRRAMYLWRRVYGEHRAPKDGEPIATPGEPARRYGAVFGALEPGLQQEFWDQIWDLADHPEALASKGVTALYGNAVYQRLRPGLIYVFKIDAGGNVFPETVPDL